MTWRWLTSGAVLLLLGCGDDAALADGGADAGNDAMVGNPDGGGTDGGGVDGGGVDGGALPRTCVAPAGADPSGTGTWEDDLGTATVTVADREACLRSYTLETTASLRDDEPDNPRTIGELEGWPTTRTGHDFFDALHALALEEVRLNSVSSIEDGAFNDGAPVDCGTGGCFETGRKWKYVWTRDTAYSVHLGLAAMDPVRARNSLEFKLSERRTGGDEQIVQDTGSGGSYPVSTDRVSWALGAWELWLHLDGSERDAFRDRALEAIANTLDHDRQVVFDASDGLYRGEQSFLDWREQSYPEWTADDVVHIATSKSLSTNLLHLRAMEVAAGLAEDAGDATKRDRYTGWADDLRTAIRERLWLEDEGMFSTFVTTALDPAPVRRWDLLGSSLAVLMDVASAAQAESILAGYPCYGPGAPVIWPQQQDVPIYHNRGEWPFVTAYWLRAAKHGGNDAVADRMTRALMRGAALNLSNMESFEASSGAPWVAEGASSGPVVNSQRQLWSVAGYLSLVHQTVFGLEAEQDGLHVRPFVTSTMREELFGGTTTAVLNDYPWRGRTVTVVLHLPEEAGTGPLEVTQVRLNGAAVSGDLLPEGMLEEQNRVDVDLASGTSEAAVLTEVGDADWRDVFGPKTPRITGITPAAGGGVTLALSTNGETPGDVSWRIYRDGEVVADGLAGTTTSWTDTDPTGGGTSSPCYAAELTFTGSGNHSQHSPPVCWWGSGATRITTIGASSMTNVGGSGSTDHGMFHYEPWGDDGHSLTVSGFSPSTSGTHLLQVTFGNGAGAISTGITSAFKRVRVEDESSGAVVAAGYLVMPHLDDWSRWEDSSFVEAELDASKSYRIVIETHDTAVNMSAFDHFEQYTGGLGGTGGEFNRVNIAELKILAR